MNYMLRKKWTLRKQINEVHFQYKNKKITVSDISGILPPCNHILFTTGPALKNCNSTIHTGY
jgi:hypothetical protein